LDSWLPEPGGAEPISEAEGLIFFAREHGITISPEEVRGLGGNDGYQALTALAIAQGVLPAADAHAHVTRTLELYTAHARGFARYRPAPVAAPITLVRPRQLPDMPGFQRVAPMDPTPAWEAMSPTALLVRETPGHHFDMLRAPNVAGLAAVVREVLS